jgi:hypothetical protein
MTLERTIAQLFRMDDATWMRPRQSVERNPPQHSAPAAHHRVLEPALAWMVSCHPCCRCTLMDMDHWMSKAVLGERVWLNRDAVPVPAYHRRVPDVLSVIAAIGLLFIVGGVLVFDPWPTLFGTMMAYMGKLWFAERMVWLWHDMQDAVPEYRSWRIYPDA